MAHKKSKREVNELFLDRQKCDCVAQKHQLINNCMNCGNIVCAREGEGPCLHCGNLVTIPDGTYIKLDENIFPSLPITKKNQIEQQRSKAILHRNELLERDRSTTTTHKIIDEQLDYHQMSNNQWLDDETRQQAINRILQKNKQIQDQTYKVKVYYDEKTGLMVREQYQHDQEQFRQEARQTMQQVQNKENTHKMAQIKGKWDERLLQNDRMKEICQLLITGSHKQKKQNKVQDNLIEIVLEQPDLTQQTQ